MKNLILFYLFCKPKQDQVKLEIYKNRLKALNCLKNNFLKLKEIAFEHKLTNCLLIKDYLGFNIYDIDVIPSSDDFIKKLELATIELQQVYKTDCCSNADNGLDYVCQIIVALKLEMPVYFIEIIFERLDSSVTERTMLFTKLAQLRIELFKNRLNILKLNELISNFKLDINFQ